jgi:Na+-driven multidrug efflux pump
VFIQPAAWTGLFSTDPAVLAAGGAYLRIVGPFYPVLGIGIALYFASLGAGRVMRPVLAASARLAVAVLGGALVVAIGAPLWAMFVVIAVAMLVYGVGTAVVVTRARW